MNEITNEVKQAAEALGITNIVAAYMGKFRSDEYFIQSAAVGRELWSTSFVSQQGHYFRDLRDGSHLG